MASGTQLPSDRQRRLRAFAYCLATDVPLTAPLGAGGGAPDLELRLATELPVEAARRGEPDFVSPYRRSGRGPDSIFRRFPGFDLWSVGEHCDFVLAGDRIELRYQHAPPSAAARRAAEDFFLGAVMSFWLEERGLLALHGSAVARHGAAVAFLARSGGGKSTLAAALVAAGWELVSDDVLAVELAPDGVRLRPAYPFVRLDAASARAVGIRPPIGDAGKERLAVGRGFGSFRERPAALACLYVLAGADDERSSATCEPLRGGAAAIELVRHSFAAHLLEALGRQPRRLSALAELSRRVSVRRLVVPRGLDRLAAVGELLERDLAAGRVSAGARPRSRPR